MNIDNTNIKKLVSWVECLCCVPITIYGIYLDCDLFLNQSVKYHVKNPSYKYEIELDQPTIKAPIDHYI